MADSASSPATLQPNPQHSEPAAPNPIPNQPDPVPQLTPSQSSTPSSTPLAANPNSNPPLASAPSLPPPPPTVLYSAGAPPQVPGVLPPSAPSFRPLGAQVPQFSPLPNPAGAYQNPTVPPPGVARSAAPVPMPPQMQPMMSYQVPSTNPALRHYAPIPNGYAAPPQGTINPAVSY